MNELKTITVKSNSEYATKEKLLYQIEFTTNSLSENQISKLVQIKLIRNRYPRRTEHDTLMIRFELGFLNSLIEKYKLPPLEKCINNKECGSMIIDAVLDYELGWYGGTRF